MSQHHQAQHRASEKMSGVRSSAPKSGHMMPKMPMPKMGKSMPKMGGGGKKGGC